MDSFEGSVAYEELCFAGVKLHQLNTATGKVFIWSEIALEIFRESPTVFAKV
jgi:hypothetical protein